MIGRRSNPKTDVGQSEVDYEVVIDDVGSTFIGSLPTVLHHRFSTTDSPHFRALSKCQYIVVF